MIRSIRLLNLRRLARIRLRTVIAVIAVAAGSSLALSVLIVTQSVSYSLSRFSQQVAGASSLQVVGATASGGIDAHALAAVIATPGVGQVTPLVQAVSVVQTHKVGQQNVVVLGVTCAATAVVGGAGCAGPGGSLAANQVVTSTLLRSQLGAGSTLETNTGSLPLAGSFGLAALNTINHGDVVVMALGTAQARFDRLGRLDVIYVMPRTGVTLRVLQSRLSRAVGGWNGVAAGTAIPPEVQLTIGGFTPLLTILAVLASGIAVVLVYNVVALTLEERRREHAIIAAVGAPLSVLIAGPLIEVGALGAVGGLLGALAGAVIARPVLATLNNVTIHLVGIPLTVRTTGWTLLVGVVVGMVIGLLATIRPLLRSLRLDITAELSSREQRERTSVRHTLRNAIALTFLTLCGLVLSWLGVRNGSLQSWQPLAAVGGFLVAAIFAILASGAWAPLVVRGLWHRGGAGGGVVRLGIANLVRDPARTGVMAVAIGAAVGVAVITSSFNHSVVHDITAQFQTSLSGHGVSVSTLAGKTGFNTDARIPVTDLATLGHLPGVAGVESFDLVIAGHNAGQLTLVEASTSLPTGLALFQGRDDPVAFARGQAIVGAGLARRDHLRAGSDLMLGTPSGFARVPIQGVWDNGNAGGNNVTMPLSLESRLYGQQLPNDLTLLPAPGVSVATVVAQARRAPVSSFLTFSVPSQELRDSISSASGQITGFWALQRALLGVSFVSVLSTLVLVGIQRRREFGLLNAIGMTPGELFSMVVAEALVVAVVGAGIGILVGLLLLDALLNATPLFVGFHDTYIPDVGSFLYAPVAVAVAVLAALWPGWRASRLPILEALQFE
ncbi:MAG TPA: FtsX-like permease family protein [Acidimicrobiales bacterium]|nr:FtsX-like permease family protein [Acidimicrobiales bacterium]